MQRASGAQRIFAAFAPLGLQSRDVTSIISGPHVKGSAHFDGRAIDVGSIAGNLVGFNRKTWDFLVRAIGSGALRGGRVGTLAEIVSNPQLRAFAQAHGVDLFEDDGATGATGPHLHLQVSK